MKLKPFFSLTVEVSGSIWQASHSKISLKLLDQQKLRIDPNPMLLAIIFFSSFSSDTAFWNISMLSVVLLWKHPVKSHIIRVSRKTYGGSINDSKEWRKYINIQIITFNLLFWFVDKSLKWTWCPILFLCFAIFI